MDETKLIEAVREALISDISDYSLEERTAIIDDISPAFRLDRIDHLTRWVLAHTLENETKQTIPDSQIESARTLGDLLTSVRES